MLTRGARVVLPNVHLAALELHSVAAELDRSVLQGYHVTDSLLQLHLEAAGPVHKLLSNAGGPKLQLDSPTLERIESQVRCEKLRLFPTFSPWTC